MKQIKIYDDFRETYLKLKKEQRPIRICTSAIKKFVLDISKQITQLKELLPYTITKDDYENGKPNPESLLLTAKKMKLEPTKLLYVGDAVNDYLAAHRAGFQFMYITKDEDNEKVPPSIFRTKNHKDICKLLNN